MIVRVPFIFGALMAVATMRVVQANQTKIKNHPMHKPGITVDYMINSSPLILDMNTVNQVEIRVTFHEDLIGLLNGLTPAIKFEARTLSPQFNILELDNSYVSRLTWSQLEKSRSYYTTTLFLELRPTYIGHAIISPDFVRGDNTTIEISGVDPQNDPSMQLKIKIVSSNERDIWNTIFIVSVTVLIVISYINLGAQLDIENLKKIFKEPGALILGFIITVLVMPAVSWFVGLWLLKDQLLYRVGSFIFACCPTASASTLWTVMFNSDKELSIGLQAISTLGSLLTMPLLLYFMSEALKLEGPIQTIRVPYNRLIQSQLVLVIALLIGWYFIGRHERAQKISSKFFKPLTFFILFFIIIFSSIVYWYIYAMFDWNITLTALMITLATYILAGLLGFLIRFDLDQAIAISISSTYKNSGIAFGVLLIAFESPDTYINYVPCLTQVLTTSIILYSIYSLLALVNWIRRRNQPDPIQATVPKVEDDETGVKKKSSRSGSGSSEKSAKEEENDEFIAMNVTDVISVESPPKIQQSIVEQKDNIA